MKLMMRKGNSYMRKNNKYIQFIENDDEFIKLMISKIKYKLDNLLPDNIECDVDFTFSDDKSIPKMLEYVFKLNTDDKISVVYSSDLEMVYDAVGFPNSAVYIIKEVEKIKNDNLMSDVIYLHKLLKASTTSSKTF